ncbi:MAG: hypothetical protein SFU91_04670 [Chloroherpetonaceae bacterium]|nr:hypothetical protein [Chloroherpetonaceae bacterium]
MSFQGLWLLGKLAARNLRLSALKKSAGNTKGACLTPAPCKYSQIMN